MSSQRPLEGNTGAERISPPRAAAALLTWDLLPVIQLLVYLFVFRTEGRQLLPRTGSASCASKSDMSGLPTRKTRLGLRVLKTLPRSFASANRSLAFGVLREPWYQLGHNPQDTFGWQPDGARPGGELKAIPRLEKQPREKDTGEQTSPALTPARPTSDCNSVNTSQGAVLLSP